MSPAMKAFLVWVDAITNSVDASRDIPLPHRLYSKETAKSLRAAIEATADGVEAEGEASDE